MKVIRLGIFETNSSSTHTMVIMSEEDFNKWRTGEILKYKWDNTFVSKEEADEIINKLKKDYAKEYNVNIEDIECYELNEDSRYDEKLPLTYDDFNDWQNLESEINYYTTKSGEKLIIVCWFGYEC